MFFANVISRLLKLQIYLKIESSAFCVCGKDSQMQSSEVVACQYVVNEEGEEGG